MAGFGFCVRYDPYLVGLGRKRKGKEKGRITEMEKPLGVGILIREGLVALTVGTSRVEKD